MIFEFIVAAVLFFGIVFYAISYLNSNVSQYSSEAWSSSLESRIVQVSDFLLHSTGNWSGGIPLVLGIASKWPVLNESSIALMDNYCENNYAGVLQKLEMGVNRIKIQIINETGDMLMDCGPDFPEETIRASIVRFALSDKNKDILKIRFLLR